MATWNLSETEHHILICNGSSCNNAGAEELTQSIRSEINQRGLDPKIHTSRTLCNGRCQDKCVLITYPDGVWYKEMSGEEAPRLVDSLMSATRLEEKISHSFTGKTFEAMNETVKGIEKEGERVKKVSKNY
ncbi:(2Fe-2S) ferredoxin domain-containing protein [Salipaludibacillus sp. HK11]|uniref:(2Fe-2S) ferredoxin domain-containing protein n=1 Tax=Salipaludibacillus sp. HK11 TaxID=3394320 RepID=UPI0039FBC908